MGTELFHLLQLRLYSKSSCTIKIILIPRVRCIVRALSSGFTASMWRRAQHCKLKICHFLRFPPALNDNFPVWWIYGRPQALAKKGCRWSQIVYFTLTGYLLYSILAELCLTGVSDHWEWRTIWDMIKKFPEYYYGAQRRIKNNWKWFPERRMSTRS